jgi:hypothetical protein
MRNGLLGSFLVLLAAAGWSFGQAPAAGTPGPAPMPVWTADDGHGSFWGGHGDGGSSACAWASVDYLLWWFKDQPLPPFLVLSGNPATDNPGALNAGGFPIASRSEVNYGGLSGVRASVGALLGGDGGLGIEAGGFILPRQSKTLTYASDANGNPVYGFRYIDTPGNPATPNAEDIFQASVPPGNPFGVGPFAGSVAIASATRLWGTEANALLGTGDGGSRLQVLAGFRYLDLSEAVSLILHSQAIDGGMVNFLGNTFPAPASITSNDTFRTRNQFYGGQIGARGEFGTGGLVFGVTGKVALGSMHEVVEVRGLSTLVSDTGAVTSVPVGQFAGPSNIGRRTRDEFAVMPEFEIKVGYQITSCLRATVGYDFLYVSRVARPGSQVDLIVNDSVNPVNGAFGVAPLDRTAFPRPLFNRTDFWAQGLTFGLELRF